MKLHLPKALFTALLAACVVTGYQVQSKEAFTAIDFSGDFYPVSYEFSFILDGDTSNGSIIGAYWGSTFNQDYGANALTVTKNDDGTYTVKLGRGKLNNNNIDSTTTFTLHASDVDSMSFDGSLQAGVLYTINGTNPGSGDYHASASISNVANGATIKGATNDDKYKNNMNGSGSQNNGVNSAYAVNGSTTLVWSGTGDSADWGAWKNTSGENAAANTDSVLYFDASSDIAETVNVSGTQSVAAIKVYDNYTLKATEKASITTTNGITISNGKLLTLSANVENTDSNELHSAINGALAADGGNWVLNGAVTASSMAVQQGTLTINGHLNLSSFDFAESNGDTISVAAGASLIISSNATFDLGALTEGTKYQIFSLSDGATLTGWADLTADNFTVNGLNLSSSAYSVTLSDGAFVYSMVLHDMTWNGSGSGTWDFTSENWRSGETSVAFANAVNATFDNTADVVVQDNIVAGNLSINSGAELTLSASEERSLSVEDLSISGGLMSSIGINVNGSVSMTQGASWDLLSGATQTLTEAQFSGISDMEIQSGATLILSSITTTPNGTINASKLSGSGVLELKLRNDNGVNFNLANYEGEIVVKKAEGENTARLQLTGSTFHENASITLAEEGSDIVVNATNYTLTTDVKVDASSTLHVNGSNEATITSTISGAGTLTKAGTNSTLNLNGNITVGTFKVNAGTVNVIGGTVSNLQSAGGTTNIQDGTVSSLLVTGGTSNVQGGIVSSLQAKGGTTNIQDGTVNNLWVEGGTANVTAPSITIGVSNVTFNGAHLTGIYIKKGTVNIGDGTEASTVTATRVEMGDIQDANGGTLNVKQNATLVVTGNDVSGNYHTTGFLLGEWGPDNGTQTSTLNVYGTVLSQNASVMYGNKTAVINIENGGVLATKGLSNNKDNNGSMSLNLKDGGKLILGSGGITAKTITANLGGGTVGITADSSITKDITLSSADGTTFNTAKYSWNDSGTSIEEGTSGGTLTISGIISGEGKLIKDGAGTLSLSGANTYSGGTTIKQGAIKVSSGAQLGNGGVEIQQYGVLDIDNQDDISITGDVTLKDGGTMIVRNGYSDNKQASINVVVENSGRIESGWGGEHGILDGSITGAGTLQLACPVWNSGYSENAWKLTAEVSDKSDTEKLAVISNTNVTMEGDNSYSGGTTIQGYTLTTKHVNALGTGKVTVNGGMLKLAEALSVSAMDYVSGSIQADNDLTVEGTLKVAGTGNMAVTGNGEVRAQTLQLESGASFTAGGQVSMNNLTMNAGSAITADSAVALNGTLTLQSGGITLAGTVLDTLEGLQAPGSGEVVLFTGVDTLVLGGQTYSVGSETLNAGSNVKLSDYFSNDRDIDFGEYYLAFNASTGDLTAGLIIPEPTTATLSLLALAGLCARRRRK